MSKERELLEEIIAGDEGGDFYLTENMFMKIRDLLAKPEQEPVATKLETPQFQSFRVSFEDAKKKLEELPTGTKIYTSPPITQREEYQRGYAQAERDLKRESLSDDEIRVIINQLPTGVDLDTGIEFCRIIEKEVTRNRG
jgi:hypothetical protein